MALVLSWPIVEWRMDPLESVLLVPMLIGLY